MSSMYEALNTVKSNIQTVEPKKYPLPRAQRPWKATPQKSKQLLNGHEVKWVSADDGSKIPYIQEEHFYTQYPSKVEDIKLPEGTVRASYNAERKRVEFFKAGQQEPIRFVNNSQAEPLPVPAYFRELEKVEEIFDIDFETGEVTSGMNIDILPEGVHWKLRLQEFEAQQLNYGVNPKVISFRLQKYLKNLEQLRGVTIEQLSAPIPQTIQDAIRFAEEKVRQAGIKK